MQYPIRILDGTKSKSAHMMHSYSLIIFKMWNDSRKLPSQSCLERLRYNLEKIKRKRLFRIPMDTWIETIFLIDALKAYRTWCDALKKLEYLLYQEDEQARDV